MTAPARSTRYDPGLPCHQAFLGCTRTDTRPYLNAMACPDHTPAALAGHPEPGATAYTLTPVWARRAAEAAAAALEGRPPAAVIPILRPKPASKAEVAKAALHIYAEAQRAGQFTDSVWRGRMERAGITADTRRRAVVHAIRQEWIEAVDVLADLPGLEQFDNRKTRWRSLVYRPRRQQRPTTNAPERTTR